MRVLMLYNDYQVLGGERLSVEEEAAGLAGAGVECHLYAVSNDDLQGLGRARAARAVISAGWSRPGLARVVADLRPDLVHAQNLFPLLARSAADVLRTTRLPWVRHLRNYRLRCVSADLWRDDAPCTACTTAASGMPGVRHACYRGSRAESLGAVLYSRTERRLFADVPPAAFIALSAGMGQALAASLPPDIPVYVKPDGLPARDPRLEDDGSARVHLFVGRLTPAKGYEHVLALARARPRLRFAVVGDGEGAGAVAAAAGVLENLTWERVLPPDVVLERMRDARAVLVPSQWEEPFGRVAAEAISVGTPAVVQATGGLTEIARPVDARLAVEGRDLQSWLEVLDVLERAAPTETERLRRRAWEHFGARYEIAHTSRALAGIYQDVLSRVAVG
jgi:glycosyltransferase involved in cell wall biosynthesis